MRMGLKRQMGDWSLFCKAGLGSFWGVLGKGLREGQGASWCRPSSKVSVVRHYEQPAPPVQWQPVDQCGWSWSRGARMAPHLQHLQGGKHPGQHLLLLLLLVPGWVDAQVQAGGGQVANQDIEVLSHICKYGVHPGGRRWVFSNNWLTSSGIEWSGRV